MARKMFQKAFLATLSIGLWMVFLSLSVNAAIYYVADNGGDDLRSKTVATNVNTPWKTISKAALEMTAGDTCYIRGGTYRERDAITPVNSGNSGAKITYANYNGETVTVSGADVLTGWTQHSGNIYKANPTTSLTLGNGNQLFVNGAMYDQARWPNNIGSSLLQPTLAVADSATATTFTDSDLTQTDGFWNNATIWCTSGSGWIGQRSTVNSYNQGTHTITFTAFPNSDKSSYVATAGNKYYLTGVLNALDVAKEWHYDSATNTMYLYKEGGGSPATVTVEVKRRNYAFNLSGRSYIDITGINFFATGLKTDSSTSNCIFSGLTARYVMHGTADNGGMQLYGSNLELKNGTIENSSGSLVMISGTGNKLNNCLVQMGNYEATWNPIVHIKSGSNNLVSDNTIREAGRACIGLSGENHQVQYNNISDAGRLTTDLGILYQANADGGNSRIHHNKVHDNRSTSLGLGIYLDNQTENFVVDHNVVWGCSEALRLNLPSDNNLAYNNTLVGTSKSIDHWGAPEDMYGNRIFNNICTASVKPTGGAVMGFNLYSTTSPLFVNQAGNDYHIQSASPAKDAGIVLAGITDGYVGTKPDMGAYEYNGTDWTAGHNFTTPPNHTFTSTNAPYMNLLKNAGFEKGNLTNWTKMSGGTAVVILDDAWGGDPNKAARSNLYGMRLGGTAVGDGLQQTITGLSPNTTYAVSAWLKNSASAERAELGAKNYGGAQVYSATNSTSWDQILREFTTGPTNTTADIYISKCTTGINYVFADVVSVTPKDPNTVPENFQSGTISASWSPGGTVSIEAAQNHESGGANSMKIGADTGYINKSFNNFLYNKIYTVWFKDDAADKDMSVAARVDDTVGVRMIGVNALLGQNDSVYSYRVGNTWYATTVSRTSAWHQFKWDYTSGTGVVMSIDNNIIYSDVSSGGTVTSFKYIFIGDIWADNKTAPTVYFDDIKLEDMDTIQ